MRPWRLLQWCLGEEGERQGLPLRAETRPRCRGRAAWGRSGDGGRSEEKVRGKKSEDAGPKGAACAGCERKRVKPWLRKIVEMRGSLWRKTGKGK